MTDKKLDSTSSFPCCPVNCECLWKKTQIENKQINRIDRKTKKWKLSNSFAVSKSYKSQGTSSHRRSIKVLQYEADTVTTKINLKGKIASKVLSGKGVLFKIVVIKHFYNR